MAKNFALKARKMTEAKMGKNMEHWQESSDHKSMREMPDKDRGAMGRQMMTPAKIRITKNSIDKR